MRDQSHHLPKFGYRDESFGGSGEHDPISVCLYELVELGNVDVPRTLLADHDDALTNDERSILHTLIRNPTNLTTDDDTRRQALDAYVRLLSRICDGRDFCLWVCRTMRDYFDAYVDAFDDDTEMRINRIASVHMTRYAIPQDAIVLADNDIEGLLLAWKAQNGNTLPTEGRLDFTSCLSPMEREPECFPGTDIPMSRGIVNAQRFDRFGHRRMPLEFTVHLGSDFDLRDWQRLSKEELTKQIRNTAAFAHGDTFIIDDNRLGTPFALSTDMDERSRMERDDTSPDLPDGPTNPDLVVAQPDDSACPFCGNPITDADQVEIARHMRTAYAEQVCRCATCGAEWVDQYVWRRAVRI